MSVKDDVVFQRETEKFGLEMVDEMIEAIHNALCCEMAVIV
tara:strand:+ start:52 stop:174 length:123 start_codon:yes stop_codon:yes gene_type:complete